jgi:methylenetetrahydrofolate--tRNA-(uracil-5-)-methyltransferase
MNARQPVTIVGGGLSGVEAALTLSQSGVPVVLYEMRPRTETGAHKTADLGELVCSNSLKSVDPETPHGLLKEELQAMGSPVLLMAFECRIPGGGALVVDRFRFSRAMTRAVEDDPGITLLRERVDRIQETRPLVLATGPLTHPLLTEDLLRHIGSDRLSFYDAISPVVESDSLDFSRLFRADRYGTPGEGDYWNVPLTEEEYRTFCSELLGGERVPPHEGVEDRPEVLRAFEACQPIESLVEKGPDTLAFGPMRPVGLVDPKTGRTPFAVVQLRAEDADGTAFNLVGFQTKLRYSEQERIFRLLPGFSEVRFLRLGSLHRNTFLDAPAVLRSDLSLRGLPGVYPTGQMVGVEGYTESVAMGHLTALFLGPRPPSSLPPETTAVGALLRALMPDAYRKTPSGEAGERKPIPFCPMNLHFGLFPSLPDRVRGGKRERRRAMIARARKDFEIWWKESAKPEGRGPDPGGKKPLGMALA